jgi:hypothetical protein
MIDGFVKVSIRMLYLFPFPANEKDGFNIDSRILFAFFSLSFQIV